MRPSQILDVFTSRLYFHFVWHELVSGMHTLLRFKQDETSPGLVFQAIHHKLLILDVRIQKGKIEIAELSEKVYSVKTSRLFIFLLF